MAQRSEEASNTAFLLFFYGTTKEAGSYGGFPLCRYAEETFYE
jgi:hypothetical protein